MSDRIAELAMGDVKDLKHELGLLNAFVHRRVMAWYIRGQEGVRGAADTHAFWLQVERDVGHMQNVYVRDARRIAERLISDAANREEGADSPSCVQESPPGSVAA